MAMQQPDVENAGLISDFEPSNKQQEVFEDEAAEIQVVKWENFKVPIPVDHATFMRKVFLALTLQLLITAGIYINPYTISSICVIRSKYIQCIIYHKLFQFRCNSIMCIR